MSRKAEPDSDNASDAINWSVELSSGEADRGTLDAFAKWHNDSQSRKTAFIQIDRVWQGMEQLSHLEAYAELPKSKVKPSFSARFKRFCDDLLNPMYGYAAAACVAIALIGFFFLPKMEPQPEVASTAYKTVHGEVKTIELADGTHVTMAPETDLRVSYTDSLRTVELIRGEGMFAVTKNPEKPFIVHAGKTHTRVLGTVFTVERRSAQVKVAVKEGRVQVEGRATAGQTEPAHRVLVQGNAVVSSLMGDVGAVFIVDPSEIGVWSEGRLSYSDASLKELVDDVNHYSKQKILIEDSATASLRVSISFEIDAIDTMLNDLAEVLNLQIDRSLEGQVILRQSP